MVKMLTFMACIFYHNKNNFLKMFYSHKLWHWSPRPLIAVRNEDVYPCSPSCSHLRGAGNVLSLLSHPKRQPSHSSTEISGC